jgi:hypothetical protein
MNTGGLLGLAFPADYASSGIFYVYFTRTDFQLVLARFEVSLTPNVSDVASEDVLLTISNPTLRHNGGTIGFSPTDGYLYMATGDGGGLYDPDEIAQNPLELRGKVLRLDVSGGSGSALTIPTDNPFVGVPGTRDEIWALGLRNPYRWSFDRVSGDLWIADVGEQAQEEVNRALALDIGGRNYGWDIMEGMDCNPNDPSIAYPCNDPALTLPIHQYDHSGGDCSITGGNVNRRPGSENGLYFYGDFCTGRIWSMDPQNLVATDRTAEIGASLPPGVSIDSIAGFGEDGVGRILIVDNDGEIFRLQTVPSAVPALAPAGLVGLCLWLIAGTKRARSQH